MSQGAVSEDKLMVRPAEGGEYPPQDVSRVLVFHWEMSEASVDATCKTLLSSSYDWALIFLTARGAPLAARYLPISRALELGTGLQQLVAGTEALQKLLETIEVRRDHGALPSVSVVIPTTFERWEGLQRAVAGVVAQSQTPLEVLVVDNRPGADPHLRERLSRDHGVRIVRAAKRGSSAARNAGLQAARGEVVAFIDDDVVPDKLWTLEIARAFASDVSAAAVTGLELPLILESQAEMMIERSGSIAERRFFPYSYERADLVADSFLQRQRRRFDVRRSSPGITDVCHSIYQTGPYGMGMNFAVRRSVVAELGGYDEHLGAGSSCRGGEDLELFFRILEDGRRLRFHPRAFVWHSNRATMDDLSEQMEGYGVGFSAALASFVVHSPVQAVGLALVSVSWARGVLRRKLARNPDQYAEASVVGASFPEGLLKVQARGRLMGPVIYARSLMPRRRKP